MQKCLTVSEVNIPFFTPEMITVSPQSESLFYVRVKNSKVKVGYISKLKLAYGIYSGDTLWKTLMERRI